MPESPKRGVQDTTFIAHISEFVFSRQVDCCLAHEGICEEVRRPGIRRRPALARAGVWSRDAKGVLAQGIELSDRPDGETHGTHAQWPLYVDLHLPLATTQNRARTWHPRSVVSGSGWAVPTVRLAAVSPSAQEGDHTPHARHPLRARVHARQL